MATRQQRTTGRGTSIAERGSLAALELDEYAKK